MQMSKGLKNVKIVTLEQLAISEEQLLRAYQTKYALRRPKCNNIKSLYDQKMEYEHIK